MKGGGKSRKSAQVDEQAEEPAGTTPPRGPRPPGQRAEDLDTARLVARFQAGDREAYTALYERYFDRVFGYLKIVLRRTEDAEDIAQQVFLKVLEALPAYERRPGHPFRAWLFSIARNHALSFLKKEGRLETLDPEEIDRRRDRAVEPELEILNWINDAELLMFIERLPLPQRQVLTMRFMLELTAGEIAKVLGRSPDDVRGIQARALLYLNKRLKAIGRGPKSGPRKGDKSARMERVPKHAPVLRERRFALH